MQINAVNNVKSFRKALIVPFILCILTFIPSVKNSYEWLEFKTLDMFFTYYPLICDLTGQKQEEVAPTVIITKDESFQEKYGRSPNRKDFADLTNSLTQQGVKVAAFDYIFDEPSNEEADNDFIDALDKLPYPVVAQNFTGRGQSNFSYVDIRDQNADKPTGLISLYKPISDKAFARGLINVPSDLDSIVRYAPLGYYLDTRGFQPTLGFSTWITTLLSEEDKAIETVDISNAKRLIEAYNLIMSNSPYNRYSIGHKGLDEAIERLETLFILNFLIKKYPRFKNDFIYAFGEINNGKKELSKKSWIKLPNKPLPLIGSYNIPCIRLPYQKKSYPIIGDNIDTISMIRLLNTEEEENSTFLFSKNQYYLPSNESFHQIKPKVPKSQPGKNVLIGDVRTLSGLPVASATLWLIMPKTGYWVKASTDEDGHYHINNLPCGNYVFIVFVNFKNGYDKAMLSIKIDKNEIEAPLLMFADNVNSIELSQSVLNNIKYDSELVIHGDIIPMLKSNKEGKTNIFNLPNGFTINYLSNNEEDGADENDREDVYNIDEKGNLFLNNSICKNETVAVLPQNDDWQLSFCRKVSLHNQQNLIIDNLPSTIDAMINVISRHSILTKKTYQEVTIKPETPIKLEKLPRTFLDYDTLVKLNLQFLEKINEDSKIIMLSNSGKEYEIKNGESIIIPSGDYYVLTQSGDARGMHKLDAIDKKTVFLGTALATDQDFVVTPINFLDRGFARMPGVQVHANLFAALYTGKFFYALPFHIDCAPNAWPFYQFLLVLPILLFLSFRLKNANSIKSTFIIVLICLTIYLCGLGLFPQRILIPIYYPIMLIMSFGITRGFIEWINFRRLANQTQNAFSRFISKEIVNQIINNPNAIKPGGEKKELTIMFTDIAGFTSISEKLDAEALTELMNNYLDEMTKILFKNGGTLDKYVGDAIMGFWNHPTLQDDHTTRAVICAIEMQKKLKEMREKWIAQGLPKVEMRAGINTGNCMVGFIGSKIQMNFTCLGDNVNLASRLEGANKAYGTFIMISESVKKQLNPYLFSTRFLDFLAVKGKNEPVLVYEVRGFIEDESEVWLDKAGKLYEQGIKEYLAREWDKAIDLFEEVLNLIPDDSPSKVYIERCQHFKLVPPEKNWDGRFILKTK